MTDVSNSILKGAREALQYAKGDKTAGRMHHVKVPKKINIKAIRRQLHVSRQEFAEAFGFSVRTLEKWERGEREPKGPTRAYLTVIQRNPKAVEEALLGHQAKC